MEQFFLWCNKSSNTSKAPNTDERNHSQLIICVWAEVWLVLMLVGSICTEMKPSSDPETNTQPIGRNSHVVTYSGTNCALAELCWFSSPKQSSISSEFSKLRTKSSCESKVATMVNSFSMLLSILDLYRGFSGSNLNKDKLWRKD